MLSSLLYPRCRGRYPCLGVCQLVEENKNCACELVNLILFTSKEFLSLSTSALLGGEWSTSISSLFNSKKEHGTHWIRRWVRPRASPDCLGQEKSPSPVEIRTRNMSMNNVLQTEFRGLNCAPMNHGHWGGAAACLKGQEQFYPLPFLQCHII